MVRQITGFQAHCGEADYEQYTEISNVIENCPDLSSLKVPHIVEMISTFALGNIVKCPQCKRSMHMLPSEVQFATMICERSKLHGIWCSGCFQTEMEQIRGMQQAYTEWWHSRLMSIVLDED